MSILTWLRRPAPRPNPEEGETHPLRAYCRLAQEAAGRYYARPEGYGWSGIPAFLLDRGHVPVSAPLTPEARAVVDAAVRSAVGRPSRLRPQLCYYNAMLLLLHDPSGRLRYVEGYVGVNGIPIEHAWIEVDRQVVDPTIRHPDGTTTWGEIRPGWSYLGVEVSRARVQARVQALSEAGPVLHDARHRFPMLRLDAREEGPFPEYVSPVRRSRRKVPA